MVGTKPKVVLPDDGLDPATAQAISDAIQQDVAASYLALSKSEREEGLGGYAKAIAAKLGEQYTPAEVYEVFHEPGGVLKYGIPDFRLPNEVIDAEIEKLRQLAASRGVPAHAVQTIQADLADFEVGTAAWDAIVSIWCHLPQALRAKVHSACVAGLKPGGLFLLEAYTPKQLQYRTGGPPTPDLLMTREGLLQELRGLEPLEARELDRVVQEGRGHAGLSAVVQFLGRKS